MNTQPRTLDVITGNNDLELLYTNKKFPIFMGCVNGDSSLDEFEDMCWYISKSSGVIQLNPVINLNILYKESHGSGTVGKMWDFHHEKFSKFIETYKPNVVLEIGGNQGILVKKYLKSNPNVDWTIIDPNVPNDLPIKTIKCIFDENVKLTRKYDTIIHSHLIEHIYDINKFLSNISSISSNNTSMIFSVPNLQTMLEKNQSNCLNFEHSFFLSEPYIDFLLSKHGFEVIHKYHFHSNNSIFYYTKKSNSFIKQPLPNLYDHNKQLFINHINYITDETNNLNNIVNEAECPIYLFGAHIFSQYLISFGLDVSKIVSVLDNDCNKQNKRLYGTNLMVESPIVLKNINKPIVILKSGIYNEEIKSDIYNNINKNVIFIE